jgi:hypothetical protein
MSKAEFDTFNNQFDKRMEGVNSLRQQLGDIIEGKSAKKEIKVNGVTVKVGDKATIPKWEWVDVMNLSKITQKFSGAFGTPTEGGIQFHQYGDFETCGVKTRGEVEVLGFLEDNRALVEYTAPGNPKGTPCPTGTKYLISTEKFLKLTGEYKRKIDNTSDLLREVQNVLEGKPAAEEALIEGRRIKKGDKFRSPVKWVEVMNLHSVTQEYRNGSKQLIFSTNGDYDTCITKDHGIITVLGFIKDGRALVEYSVNGDTRGTPCPDGTRYLINSQDLADVLKSQRNLREL